LPEKTPIAAARVFLLASFKGKYQIFVILKLFLQLQARAKLHFGNSSSTFRIQ
jgi:hypothetical protein